MRKVSKNHSFLQKSKNLKKCDRIYFLLLKKKVASIQEKNVDQVQ